MKGDVCVRVQWMGDLFLSKSWRVCTVKIAVAGTGYVGLANAVLIAQHHEVVALDIVEEKVRLINEKKRSEEHTSELQSRGHLVCRLLLEKKNKTVNEVIVLRLNIFIRNK